MKYFIQDIKKIYAEERNMLILMVFNIMLALVLLVMGIININPNVAIVKIGYGDIGGYRDGTFVDMLVFPIMAIILGVFHNLIAMKIFHKRGAGMTKFFVATTTMLILGAFIVLIRLK